MHSCIHFALFRVFKPTEEEYSVFYKCRLVPMLHSFASTLFPNNFTKKNTHIYISNTTANVGLLLYYVIIIYVVRENETMRLNVPATVRSLFLHLVVITRLFKSLKMSAAWFLQCSSFFIPLTESKTFLLYSDALANVHVHCGTAKVHHSIRYSGKTVLILNESDAHYLLCINEQLCILLENMFEHIVT